MSESLAAEIHFPNKQHLALLHSLEILLKDGSFDEADKSQIKEAVHNILEKREDTRTIITGIRSLLVRTAISNFKVKNYKVGIRVLKVLDKLKSKVSSLCGRDIEITRIGSDKNTQYQFMPDAETPLSKEDKELQKLNFVEILKPRGRAKMLAFMEDLDEPEDTGKDKVTETEDEVPF